MKRKLFNYLYKVHGANLLDSELNEVINIVNPCKKDQQLLDHFAGMAMQGICVNAGRNGHHCNRVDKIAQSAYDIAEAMLKERERIS